MSFDDDSAQVAATSDAVPLWGIALFDRQITDCTFDADGMALRVMMVQQSHDSALRFSAVWLVQASQWSMVCAIDDVDDCPPATRVPSSSGVV